MHVNMFAGHEPETFHVPGGFIVAARHRVDLTICAIVIRTVHGDYLAIDHYDYGPIPPEIITELRSAETADELYDMATRLGFSQYIVKSVSVIRD